MAEYKGPASESQRVMNLQKRRERHQEEMDFKKKKLADELKVGKMEAKFSAHYDAVENDLKSSTVGLLTMEEMKTRQDKAVRERERLLARKDREEAKELKRQEKAKEKAKQKQNQQIKALSFNPDDDEDEEEADSDHDQDTKTEDIKVKVKSEDAGSKDITESEAEQDTLKRKRFGKDPTVDTSFLPDVERDEEENKLREELRQKWAEKQAALKAEEIDITFSYWDGSGHRRNIKMKKGNSIYQFLQKSLEDLRPDFPELRAVTADQLMYVKEDIILPQTNTFYDFIVTKVRKIS